MLYTAGLFKSETISTAELSNYLDQTERNTLINKEFSFKSAPEVITGK